MSCTTVERRIVRFPFLNKGRINVGCIPGSASYGTGIFMDTDGKVTAPDPTGDLSDNVVQRISFPKSRLPLRAISIAQDSAIACCDIWLGGAANSEAQRFRVSAGDPLVGDLDVYDAAGISIPIPIHGLSSLIARHWVWDGSPITGLDPQSFPAYTIEGTLWSLPLALDIWHGDALPLRSHRRSVYTARARIRMLANQVYQLTVCVNGRSRISIAVFTPNTTTTMLANSLEAPASPSAGGVSTVLLDKDGPSSAPMPFGCTIWHITQGLVAGQHLGEHRLCPIDLLNLQFVDTAGTGASSIDVIVKAWDD